MGGVVFIETFKKITTSKSQSLQREWQPILTLLPSEALLPVGSQALTSTSNKSAS